MKFLLTSNGLANKTIANALIDLLGKPASNASVAFIPTASNVETGDKSWLINDLSNIKKQGFKSIDIVDISALPQNLWQPRLESADVLFFSGGNSSHLMMWLEKSGLADLLPQLLKTRVYAGISAGSIVVAPTLALSNQDKLLLYAERFGYRKQRALGFVDFHIRPHLNSSYFPKVRREILEKIAKQVKEPIYALDDQSALKIVDGKIEVVGEGEYLILNQNTQEFNRMNA